ncbi:MAG: sulfite exporter TauE/SafE family protein [Chloroflexota bacterium]
MTPLQIVIFIFACILIGLSKGGLGGPLPVSIIVPTLALVMDAKEAVALILPFLIFGDLFALRVYWQQWDIEYIKLMLPIGLVGVIMGTLLLTVILDTPLKIIIGIATLFVIIYKLLSDKLQSLTYTSRKWHGYLAGWVSAFTSTLASTGGPPFTIYMLLQRVQPIPFIATTTLYFAIINISKIPIFWQQGLLDFDLLLSVIWAMPIVPVGVWLGKRALNWFSPIVFERIMMVLLALSVIVLFATL